MSPTFEKVQNLLRRLPGLGYRSAERIAMCLLVEKPALREELIGVLGEAAEKLQCCSITGNLCEGSVCAIYSDPDRSKA